MTGQYHSPEVNMAGTRDKTDWEQYREFATPLEQQYIDAIGQHPSMYAAAKANDWDYTNMNKSLNNLKRRAAVKGFAPAYDMTHVVPDGFMVRGVSTYYDQDGNVRGQWVKSKNDETRAHELREAFLDAMRDDIERQPPIPPPQHTMGEFLNLYVYGDPHIGMRAWAEETGESHDLARAEALFVSAHNDLVMRSPPSSKAIILNLGDYFHADDGRNVTLRSGHHLDVDGRYQKVRKAGFKILRAMIQMCLERHDHVTVWNIQGNHDDFSAIDLSLWLSVAYENEPRVCIETSPSKFYFHRHGEVMLAATHGDTVKPERMLGIMASDHAEMWGATQFRYAHLGHVHHKTLRDYPGLCVETHRVLQPNDLWAHNAGYRSQRDAQCITYHADHGEYGRTIVNPSMFKV